MDKRDKKKSEPHAKKNVFGKNMLEQAHMVVFQKRFEKSCQHAQMVCFQQSFQKTRCHHAKNGCVSKAVS